MDISSLVLGIELGSTRIKAVLIDENHVPVASGSHEWENRLENGIWTYSMQDIIGGVQACYKDLKRDVKEKFGAVPTGFAAMGVSAMMHGYLPFDENWQLLAPFRTWRNTVTGEAAEQLSEALGFNIPQRWSIAHLYQAILNGEEHLPRLRNLTTLAGFIHHTLTGLHVMGVGEASGMFPIDSKAMQYDARMVAVYDKMAAEKGFTVPLLSLLPAVLPAGANAGTLTAEGARFLDPEGDLLPGTPVAPCEGDAGTGMAATCSVRPRTGNVSAGTSDFAMLVTETMPGMHREIDMVTTPAGAPVAMVHCNNCTSDINAWVNLLSEFAGFVGADIDKGTLFTKLFNKAMEGDRDCGGLLSYNYFSGEGVTDMNEGRPLFLRLPDAKMTLANFMRAHILSALSTLKIGLDILTRDEKVTVDKLYGHGGFFKTPGVGQRMLSAAVGAPVSVMETAGEGGPYGMALLAAYMIRREENESLEDYLDNKVFKDAKVSTLMADEEDIAGFNAYLARYAACLPVEKLAAESLR